MSSAKIPQDSDGRKATIARNIDRVKSFTPCEMARKRRRRVVLETFRAQVAKEACVSIREERRESQRINIEGKIRRFELRMMGDKLQFVSTAWATVFTGMAMAGIIKKVIMRKQVRNRQRLRARTKRACDLLYQSARIIGKLIRRLKVRRELKAFAVLIKQTFTRLNPFLKLWIRKRKSKFSNLIADFLSYSLYLKQQRKIMERWIQRMDLIRSFLQSVVEVKKAQVELVVMQWERYEAETLQDLRRRAGRRMTIAQRTALAEVPRYIKETQSYRYRRNLQVKFLKALRTFFAQTKAEENSDSDTVPIVKPHFSVILDLDDLITLHRNAMKTRHMWDPTLYHPQTGSLLRPGRS